MLPTQNDEITKWAVCKAEVIAISLLFTYYFIWKTRWKIKLVFFGQTYFWNKGGLKLFLFQENGPFMLFYRKQHEKMSSTFLPKISIE